MNPFTIQSLGVVLVFGVVAGMDNFQAACALGMLPLSGHRKLALGLSFGLCESGSTLAGLLAGQFLRAHVFPGRLTGAVALLISGGTILYLSWAGRSVEDTVNDGAWMIFGLPLSLSLPALPIPIATKAATSCTVPAPLISMPAFSRRSTSPKLGEAGRVLLRYATKAAETMAEAQKALAALNDEVVGELRLGASTTVAQYVLPRILGAFLKQYPVSA